MWFYISDLLRSEYGPMARVSEKLGVCRARETAANDSFRRVSSPGLRRPFLNLRLCGARESQTGFDYRRDRFDSCKRPFVTRVRPRKAGAYLGVSGTPRVGDRLDWHEAPTSKTRIRNRQAMPNLISWSAQRCGSVRASVDTVRSAGAVPFAIVSMRRGDTKASGARNRTCRSTLFSANAMSVWRSHRQAPCKKRARL
jgi:hypothetical protein